MLDERQRRERDYHARFAKSHRDKINEPVELEVIEGGPRRPWNGYWTAYDLLLAEMSSAGKRVLVPGCGFGDDAIRLAKLRAEVYAFDLSPDLLEIARQRAAKMSVAGIHFDEMPAEALAYPDNFFDLVYFNDILHHVNILKSVAETRRVLKLGGKVIANEPYTHSLLQRARESHLVTSLLYPRMVRFIYRTDTPYITEDEHKIDERELALLTSILQPESLRQRYFLFLMGRIFPLHWGKIAKLDRALFAMMGPARRIFAGRVVLTGTVAK
jgi:ubiquinone/menaquinone biosynthesis C-methylase UbiE